MQNTFCCATSLTLSCLQILLVFSYLQYIVYLKDLKVSTCYPFSSSSDPGVFCDSLPDYLLRSHSKKSSSAAWQWWRMGLYAAMWEPCCSSSKVCFCLYRCRHWWETCSGCDVKTAALSVWSSLSLLASSPYWRVHSGNKHIHSRGSGFLQVNVCVCLVITVKRSRKYTQTVLLCNSIITTAVVGV